MEQQSAAVSRGRQEAGENPGRTQRQRAQWRRNRPNRQRLDLQADLARLTILVDRRCMRELAVDGRDAGGGVPQGASLGQLRGQHQVVERGGG